MIRLERVTVTRGGAAVVRGLELEVRVGDIFWVTGPNGAGKSSLLRVMAGLDRPAEGRVVRPDTGRLPRLYFHSEMRLPPSARVRDWDRLAAVLIGPAAQEPTPVRPRVDRSKPARRLSTGEGKRLLLDVLLRVEGDLILDEPFEHLSPDAKSELLRRLVARSRHHLVVVATNQLVPGARIAHGIRLEGGVATPVRIFAPGREEAS